MVTKEISIGDYVPSGGELAAMVLIVVTRLVPGCWVTPATFERPRRGCWSITLHPPGWLRAEGAGVLSRATMLIVRWRRQALRRTLLRRTNCGPRPPERADRSTYQLRRNPRGEPNLYCELLGIDTEVPLPTLP